ncbi:MULTISPECIES: JAB domain-containing protein [Bombella]|uniref:DNA repair protein RadC n=1 Tax=Bombella pollinis TaxID=2967337 RepID=A0ABT3WNH3_9PROT|nr:MULTISPECIES: DNA repair protein RadC [Bombella]MCX5620468.1 DNA repair protein RadC [Bombella pollinis]MUG04647.1 DNA repair protein RadC [Bombella sp. ESL0378]MUG90187.1 DNA repair protein RadC [Bombella sp. ESL0385]
MASPQRDDIFAEIASLIFTAEDAQQGLTSYLIAHYESFADLLCTPTINWEKLPRETVALPVLCAIVKELAHRYSRALLPEGDLLKHPELLYDYLMIHMARERVEQFRLLFLDKHHRLILDEIQTRGTINHAPVYPREVAKRCIELNAFGLIMVHNHPSGQVMPSKKDVIMTQSMERALQVVEVSVVDHLIVTRKALTSFRQLGLLS